MLGKFSYIYLDLVFVMTEGCLKRWGRGWGGGKLDYCCLHLSAETLLASMKLELLKLNSEPYSVLLYLDCETRISDFVIKPLTDLNHGTRLQVHSLCTSALLA